MINIQNVTKYFGKFRALDNVSCQIAGGEIVGILGQNGAGKTTLMRILTGYLPPSSGSVTIGGDDVNKKPLAIRRRLGYLPEVPPLYPQMTIREYLCFAAKLKDIPAKDIRVKVDKALNECTLFSAQHKLIGHLSLGFRQRVGIAQAVLNDPDVLILDEPTKGLDPIQVRQIRSLMMNLKEKRTVLLSTHVLTEIEQVAQRVLMLDRGKIIADSPLAELYKTHGGSLEDIFFKLNAPPREEAST